MGCTVNTQRQPRNDNQACLRECLRKRMRCRLAARATGPSTNLRIHLGVLTAKNMIKPIQNPGTTEALPRSKARSDFLAQAAADNSTIPGAERPE